MADKDKVKLYEDGRSPYVSRVKIALNLKGIIYENIIEDHSNKSPDLIKYNPVYKKVPVLVHHGNPISESLVIVEYIDDVWKGGVPILPKDPYEKAAARFWANFIDDKCLPAIYNGIRSKGDEQVMSEAYEQLQILENELKIRVEGKKFFGGDKINLVDIAAVFLAYWPGIIEETSGVNSVPKDKFPKITEWADNLLNLQVVKEILLYLQDQNWFYFSRSDMVIPALFTVFISNGDEPPIAEACEQLKILENELRGQKFSGGDNINLIDITADLLAYWLGAAEEATGIEILTKEKFPKLTEWAHNFIQCETVKDILLPPKAHLIALFKNWFGKA